MSEITLGEGTDSVIFNTMFWLTTEGNHQPLSEAPWILDFDPAVDKITELNIENRDDLSKSLDPRYIYAVNITSGSALIYDHPVRDEDFCFARFAGVSAEALDANIALHTTFY